MSQVWNVGSSHCCYVLCTLHDKQGPSVTHTSTSLVYVTWWCRLRRSSDVKLWLIKSVLPLKVNDTNMPDDSSWWQTMIAVVAEQKRQPSVADHWTGHRLTDWPLTTDHDDTTRQRKPKGWPTIDKRHVHFVHIWSRHVTGDNELVCHMTTGQCFVGLFLVLVSVINSC